MGLYVVVGQRCVCWYEPSPQFRASLYSHWCFVTLPLLALFLFLVRLHLEKLGHPIVNDYLYNPQDKLARYEFDLNLVEVLNLKLRNSIVAMTIVVMLGTYDRSPRVLTCGYHLGQVMYRRDANPCTEGKKTRVGRSWVWIPVCKMSINWSFCSSIQAV